MFPIHRSETACPMSNCAGRTHIKSLMLDLRFHIFLSFIPSPRCLYCISCPYFAGFNLYQIKQHIKLLSFFWTGRQQSEAGPIDVETCPWLTDWVMKFQNEQALAVLKYVLRRLLKWGTYFNCVHVQRTQFVSLSRCDTQLATRIINASYANSNTSFQ